jgi:DNA primase
MKEILEDLGVDAGYKGGFKDSGVNIQLCCPFHQESRPSAGIHVEDGYGHCFGCGETFTLPKLVAFMKDMYKENIGGGAPLYDYTKAIRWLEDNYNYEQVTTDTEFDSALFIDDYIDDAEEEEERFTLPPIFTAPFKCGKATHEYYYDRGFSKDDVRQFRVGWDKVKNRVVFPVYYEDDVLCGVIGRAVLNENHKLYDKTYFGANCAKYYIYENAPIKYFLYPLWLFKPRRFKNGAHRAILVEGFMDAQWLHKHGYPETLSTVVSKMAFDKAVGYSPQIEKLIALGVNEIILFKDNDEAGERGNEKDAKQLMANNFKVYSVTYPSDDLKDPQTLSKSQIDYMIKHRRPYKAVNSIVKLK